MKKESVKEYLARGGDIEQIPYQEPESKIELIKPLNTGLPQIMTLDDGAHYFGETRKKKQTKESFLNKVKKSKLPQHVIDSLTKSVKGR